MKPIAIIFEFDPNNYGVDDSGWKPGYFRGRFRDGYFKRVWWGCFAIAWVRMPLWDYNAYIASGATEWRNK